MSAFASIALLLYLVIAVVAVRILATLNLFQWSQSSCQPVNTEHLKTWQMKMILDQKGIDYSTSLSNSALARLVHESGVVTQVDLDTVSKVSDDNIVFSELDFEKFHGHSEMIEKVNSSTLTIWLIFQGNTWVRRVFSDLRNWFSFLKRLSKQGIKLAFQECHSKWDCPSNEDEVMLIHVSYAYGKKILSNYLHRGRLTPSNITSWIFLTLSDHIVTEKSIDYIENYWKTTESVPIVAVNSRHSSPLSYAIVAAEFKGLALFVWIEDLTMDPSTILVKTPSEMFIFDTKQCLTWTELRILLHMLIYRDACAPIFLLAFFIAVGFVVPAFADKGKRIQSFFWYFIKYFIVILLASLVELYLVKYFEESYEILMEMFTVVILKFLPDFLHLFRLISEYPFAISTFPIYIAFVHLCLHKNRSESSYNQDGTFTFNHGPLKPVPAGTKRTKQTWRTVRIKERRSEHCRSTVVAPRNITENVLVQNITEKTVPVLNTSASKKPTSKQIEQNFLKQITSKQSDSTQNSSNQNHSNQNDSIKTGTNGVYCRETAEQYNSNRINSSVSDAAETQTLPSEFTGALMPATGNPDFLSSNASPVQNSLASPFQYPSLGSTDGFLDLKTQAQLSKFSIPEFWLLPIISKECLQKLVIGSTTEILYKPSDLNGEDLCFFCGTGFQLMSKIFLLPCNDAFHPDCFTDWAKIGEIDCPKCQRPVYRT